jgi:PST family polysaccharide transporter
MAVPGIILTLTFAPLVMIIFYSKDFLPAVDILRWQVLGVLIQVITWSMGYLLRAKAAGTLFIVTEFYSFSCYIAATWVGIKVFGLAGSGMAYFAYNALYMLLIYPILYKRFDFRLNKETGKIACYSVIIVAAALSVSYLFPQYHIVINSIIAIGAAYYSYKKLELSKWLSKIIEKIRKLKKA